MSTVTIRPVENTPDARAGRIIETLMSLQGVKRIDMAHALGMSPQALSNKIAGARGWKHRELDQVATLLAVPLALLSQDPDEVLETLTTPGRSMNYRSA